MKIYRHIISTILLALLAAACGSAPTSDPVSVIQAYHAAVNAKNANTAVALFAGNGVLYDPFGAYTGKGQIRTRLAYLFDSGITFEISNVRADGESVMWEQIVRENGEAIDSGPSRAVMRARKILSLSPATSCLRCGTRCPAAARRGARTSRSLGFI